MTAASPDFLIVGSPRSGTTLAQRLVSEIEGVVVPPETHFFSDFYRELTKRHSFPLDENGLRAAIGAFLAMKYSEGLRLNSDEVVAQLDGFCRNPAELFGAITRAIAGPAKILGEKTPDHLRWWLPLSVAFPRLRILSITRDPRAVVASTMQAKWGGSPPEMLALRWRLDQQELARAAEALSPKRFFRIRYEDMVNDPDGGRMAISRWLGLGDAERTRVKANDLFLSWEQWKARATGPITTDRIDAWTRIIEPIRVANILLLCRDEMSRLGYWGGPEQEALESRSKRPLSTDLRIRIARASLSRLRERRWISRQRLSW